MATSREELMQQMDEAEWGWLSAHLERGGLIIVAPGLDLVEAGMRIAGDDAESIGVWIGAGRLSKPSAEQIAVWDLEKQKRFKTLIISPYVLIQEFLQ